MDTERKQSQGVSAGDNLAPIPTPPGTQWREFRIRYVPLFTFVVAAYVVWSLWRQLPPNTGIRGLGEGAMSQLTAPQDGYLTKIAIAQYGQVDAGQPIATIVPFDPAAKLDVLQQRLSVARLAAEPSLGDRNAVNFQGLRVDNLRLQQELAMARANLDQAESKLPRYEQLFKERLVSKDEYETVLRDRNYYRTEISEKTKAIDEINKQIDRLQPFADTSFGTNAAVAAIMKELEKEIATVQTNWNPMNIVSPISGKVSFLRQVGEFVRAGDPIFVVNSTRADRIIAYIKQPIPFEPVPGMTMEVITRSRKPQKFTTQIAEVGGRIEVITNALALVVPGMLVDTALPVVMPVPPGSDIRPGEIVDIVWKGSPTDSQVTQKAKFQ